MRRQDSNPARNFRSDFQNWQLSSIGLLKPIPYPLFNIEHQQPSLDGRLTAAEMPQSGVSDI
jgi:hypothetical protein